MAMISEKDQQTIRDIFAKQMTDPVKLVYFTQKESPLLVPGQECQYCKETRELLQEVADLSDQVELEVHDFVAEGELAKSQEIDQIPAIEIKGKAKGRVRFFGIPAGYEFSTLIEDIIDVSTGKTKLTEKTRAELAKLTTPVHIQVFVTPT